MLRFANLLLTASLLFLSTNFVNAQTSCSFIVHVTTTGNDVAGCGGEGTPCQTINYGINEAISQGLSDVRVSNGLYNEVVELQTGVNVWGGYDASWNQVGTTTLNGLYSGTYSQYLTIKATSVVGGVILSDFTINAPNAIITGKSSYGIHMVNSDVVVQNCIINGGSGAAGSNGLNGTNGIGSGTNGTNGENGADAGLCSTVIANGGAGGPGNATSAGGNGGNGGAADVSCPFGPYTAQDGIFGENAATYNWPTWGSAGANGQECVDGTGGNDGIKLSGSGGAGAFFSNALIGNWWVSSTANNGTMASDGTGGGGGGGGGGCDTGSNGYGGGGGGGAAGGPKAISVGYGAGSGGNSVCIYAASSTITMINTTIDIGTGGNGGTGGTSGFGGPGGVGGVGGAGGTTSGAGGNGGNGGAGGDSGSGGGGAGGSAYGIYIVTSTALSNNVTYISGTAGALGAAGFSVLSGGTDGIAGSTMNVGNVSSTNNVTTNLVTSGICTEIITMNLATTSFCVGDAFSVDYTAVGDFTAGNIFSVELSDAFGSFASPTVIGTLASLVSGSIPALIPLGTLPGTGYKIRVVSSLQAATGSEALSVISISSLPFVSYSVSGNSTLCIGGAVTLTGIGTDTYSWNNGITNGQSFNPTVTADYIVTGTNTASGCSNTDTITITVNPTSASTLTVASCGDYLSDQGNTYTTTGMYDEIYANTFGCDSTVTIDLTVNSISASTISVTSCGDYISDLGNTYTTTGMYDELYSNISGCDSTVTIDLTVTTNDLTVTVASGVYSSAATGTYQWLDCTTGYSIIAGETGQTFTPTSNGNYAVEITNGACVDTTVCIPIFDVGIIELTSLTNSVYPNPTTGKITISMNDITGHLTIEVMNLTGQVIATEEYSQTNSVELNIDGANGVYFIHLTSDDSRSQVIKVIKKN